MSEKVGTLLADQIDEMTGALITIEYEHHEVHEGDSFLAFFGNDCTNTNEMTVIAFNTPDSDKKIHMVFRATATALAQVSIYQDTSIDNGEGTEIDVVNRNFNSSNTSIVTSIEASPVAGEVTTLNESQASGANITTTNEKYREVIGQSGNSQSKAGGVSRGQAEFVLDPGKQYAFVIKSLDDNDNHHHINLDWYEHTDTNLTYEYTRSIV